MRLSTRLGLWIAQGFGTGLIPLAPGTFGSLVGLAWFACLVPLANLPVMLGATLAAVGLAIPCCTRAESLLQTHDPGSVVLDEIVAVPLVYLGWWFVEAHRLGHPPSLASCFSLAALPWLGGGFLLFRVLDAVKPPPVAQCQSLPAGWGIVTDDVVAALIAGSVLALARHWTH